MAQGERYLGFNTTQIQTLERLFADNAAAEVQPVANEANIATADGTDAATTQALANSTKAKMNALLVKLRDSGLLDA